MTKTSKTAFHVHPFGLFGAGGAADGAKLLGEAVEEMINDARNEEQPSRVEAWRDHVDYYEYAFETIHDYESWRSDGRAIVREALRDDLFFWFTGNHLGAMPLYDELSNGDSDAVVVQFDAHFDVFNLSDSVESMSHGNFVMHCEKPLPNIVHVGSRDLLLPKRHVATFFSQIIRAEELAVSPNSCVEKLRRVAGAASRIVIDIDCDVFDPAFFPAVAKSAPFGLSPTLMLRLLDCVWGDKVCAVVLSEFIPDRDDRERSLETLMWLIESLLLRRYE